MSDSPEPQTPPEAVELAHQMFDLARAGETSELTGYVDRGAPVNMTDADGNTLLMTAAYHGHAELVTDLAERGADVDALNDRGQSPLAGAVFKGEDAVVHALVEAGADPHRGSPSALECAHFLERAELAELMQAHERDRR
ncbi:MAG: ankyrin repeat domain-containing protein [Actinomycetota bacterium]|nr:ankyrin repeat domain-containing protein [Actinomycetota bacterium]